MLELIYPPSRIESLLAKAIGEEEAMPAPEWLDVPRLEAYLTVLTGGEADLPEYPMSNIEKFLAYKCGQTDVELPTPITRIEKFLAKDTPAEPEEMPEPQTRIEQYLYEWEPGGGGDWYTYTGNLPATITAVAHALASLTRYGLCTQDGTPTPDAPVDIVCNNGALKYSANMANVNAQTASIGYYINAQGAVLADQYNWFYQSYIPVKPNTTYTLSMSSPVYYVTISEYSTADDSGFIIRKTGTPGGNTSLTITTGANTNFLRFGTNLDRTEVTLEEVLAIDWMLNIGSTAMDYQPYVEGGIYCGGTHPGQNLVDLTAVTDDYYYDSNGVYTAFPNTRLTDYIYVKAGQKYTVYVKAQRAGVSANVRCNLFDSAKVWKSQSTFIVNSGSEGVGVITPTEDGYLRVSANYAGTGAQADWSKLQIVRGEYTLATMPPYEPYTEVPYTPEVLTVRGKNLLDQSQNTSAKCINGSGQEFIVSGIYGHTAFIPVMPNTTYSWSGCGDVGGVTARRGVMYSGNSFSDFISSISGQNNDTGQFTTTADTRYVVLNVRTDKESQQLELGSTATVYEPYVSPQTVNDVPMLLAVGDYKDEVELVGGPKTVRVGVYAVIGGEAWGKYNGVFFCNDAILPAALNVACMCTRYAGVSGSTALSSMQNGQIKTGTSSGASRLFIRDDSCETADDLKAKLSAMYAAGEPPILTYPLATETTEQTTAQHLVTHKGVNVVDSTANVEPVEVEIEYYSDTPPNLSLGRGLMGANPNGDPADEPAEDEPTDEPTEDPIDDPQEMPEEEQEMPEEEQEMPEETEEVDER